MEYEIGELRPKIEPVTFTVEERRELYLRWALAYESGFLSDKVGSGICYAAWKAIRAKLDWSGELIASDYSAFTGFYGCWGPVVLRSFPELNQIAFPSDYDEKHALTSNGYWDMSFDREGFALRATICLLAYELTFENDTQTTNSEDTTVEP